MSDESAVSASSDQDEALRARKTAMDLLARREHSRQELVAKLRTRGYPGAVVDGVVDRLAAAGLLDERRFAEAFIAARARRGKGPLWVTAELRQRGLSDAIIDESLGEAGIDWQETARRVAQKKFGAAPPADLRERARRTRFLEYRGFAADDIRAALDD